MVERHDGYIFSRQYGFYTFDLWMDWAIHSALANSAHLCAGHSFDMGLLPKKPDMLSG
jgi:hypothetical protein